MKNYFKILDCSDNMELYLIAEKKVLEYQYRNNAYYEKYSDLAEFYWNKLTDDERTELENMETKEG